MIHFDDQTKILREKLVTMAVLAEAAVQGAIKALVNRDDGLASAAREEDKAIDELQIEIDDLAVGLLTKGVPPAMCA